MRARRRAGRKMRLMKFWESSAVSPVFARENPERAQPRGQGAKDRAQVGVHGHVVVGAALWLVSAQ
jgi:hypothetical protein